MRRASIVAALALALGVAPARAQTVIVGVGGELSGEVGGQVRVPIYADMRGAPGVKLGSYTVRLQWDPAVLSLGAPSDVEAGSFGQPLVNSDSVYYGVLRVGGVSATGLDGLFDLFAVRFDVVSGGSTAVNLTVSEVVAATTFSNLTSQVTVVSGSYCAAVGRWGDLDGDGRANSRDALAILSAIVGLTVDPAFTISLGDVDGDGTVNSRDALITLSYAVGLPISGQRVLVLAPGACGSTGATTLALLPDTLDLVINQTVQVLIAGYAGGGSPAGTNASWTTDDPGVASVGTDGVVVGRGAGTTTVTASVGPGITATVPVIVRARRGVWYVDATKATLAAIQMGTTRYPFATPQFAYPFVSDGDTVRVAPGVHDYASFSYCVGSYCYSNSTLLKGIVLIGDTLPDGTRPVLRGNADAYYGVNLDDGAWIDVRDLEFRNFDFAVFANGQAQFMRLQNVRIDAATYGGGIASYYSSSSLDSVVLRGVFITSDSLLGDYGVDVENARLVLLNGVTMRSRYGVYAYQCDSVDVQNSDFQSYTYDAVDAYGDYNRGGVGVYFARNRVVTLDENALYVDNARNVRLEQNRFELQGQYAYEPVYVDGLDYPGRPGTRFTSFADSVVRQPFTGGANSAYGYYVYDLDSIIVDSITMIAPDSGTTFYSGELDGNTVRLMRSELLNVGSSYPLYLSGSDVAVTGSRFTGCRAACGTAYGIEADAYGDSLTRAEFSGNTFYRLAQPIWIYPSSNPYRVYVTGNTADSITNTAFTLYGDSIFVTDNVVTRAFGYGIYAAPGTSDPPPWVQMERNHVTLDPAAGGYYALYVTSAGVASTGNYLMGSYYGAYLYNYLAQPLPFTMTGDTLVADSALSGYAFYVNGQWNGVVNSGRILGGSYGAYISMSGGDLVFDSTVFSGTKTAAIYTSASAGVGITGRKNNVKSNRTDGLYVAGSGTVAFTLGRFVGNGRYGVVGAVDASANWWGSASGPGPGTGGDSTSGNVVTTGFLTSDPEGVTVPLAPPVAALFAAAAWRSPLSVAAAPPTPAPVVQEQRADPRTRRAEREALLQQRLTQHQQFRQERETRLKARKPSR